MRYYCIHHPPATDRKEYICDNIYDIYPIEWIESYHPESDSIRYHPTVRCEHAVNRQCLNAAELSCFMKHREAVRRISIDHEYGFIFEDDIEKPEFDLKELLLYFQKEMSLNSIDLLFVGSCSGLHFHATGPTVIYNTNTVSRCAHAYIVNPDVAHKILCYSASIIAPWDWQLNYAIRDLKLQSGWTYPHILQRTEQAKIQSLLR